MSVQELSQEIRGITYNILHRPGKDTSGSIPPLLFLHGFLGSGRQFAHIIDRLPKSHSIFAPDLIGHGKTGIPDNPARSSSGALTDDLRGIQQIISEKPGRHQKPVLIGYSMGGRLALQAAVRYPDLWSGVILESATPGISDPKRATERRRIDADRANKIQSDYSAFLETWDQNPVFQKGKKIPEPLMQNLIRIREGHHPTGPALSLRGFGTGSMPNVVDKVSQIPVPVLLITGGMDEKFTNIARQLQKRLPDCSHEIVEDCGHRVHLEDPDAYLRHIEFFIENRITKSIKPE